MIKNLPHTLHTPKPKTFFLTLSLSRIKYTDKYKGYRGTTIVIKLRYTFYEREIFRMDSYRFTKSLNRD